LAEKAGHRHYVCEAKKRELTPGERIPHNQAAARWLKKRRNNQSARELYTAHNYYSTTTCLFVYANERGGRGRQKDLWSAVDY
jgi:hypothetical protein